MAKGKRTKNKERKEKRDSLVDFIKVNFPGLNAVYNRKVDTIFVYPQKGHVLWQDAAQDILELWIGAENGGVGISFFEAPKNELIFRFGDDEK